MNPDDRFQYNKAWYQEFDLCKEIVIYRNFYLIRTSEYDFLGVNPDCSRQEACNKFEDVEEV